MITEDEKQEIIDKAVEKALLMLPDVVGNLMANHAMLAKINSKFYADYPEFSEHKDCVAAVVEMVEGKNPMEKYEDILKKAVPEIRQRIAGMKNLDTKAADRPKSLSFNGEL